MDLGSRDRVRTLVLWFMLATLAWALVMLTVGGWANTKAVPATVALAALGLWKWSEWKNGWHGLRLGLADGAIVFALGQVVNLGHLLVVVVGILVFRAVYDARVPRDGLGGIALIMAGYLAAVVVAGDLTPDGAQVVNFAIAGTMIASMQYTVTSILLAHQDAIADEGARAGRREAFLAAVVGNLAEGIVAVDASGERVFESGPCQRPPLSLLLEPVPSEPGVTTPCLFRADGATPVSVDAAPGTVLGALGTLRNEEYVARLPNGDARLLVANVQRVHDAEGTVIGGVLTASDVTAWREAQKQLVRQAHHDNLTGLPNRASLVERLDQAVADAASSDVDWTLIVLDIDDFADVNEIYGHDAGDDILKAVSAELTRQVTPGTTVARVGGDEFALILLGIGVDEAVLQARRLLKSVGEPLNLVTETTWRLRMSAGIASYQRGDTGAVILGNAVLAMHEAKKEAKGGWAVYRPNMHTEAVRRVKLTEDLAGALSRGELSVAYQPIVSFDQKIVSSVEAVLRWKHPVEGLISPTQFIPLAEMDGTISKIGSWVLREACRQMALWRHTPELAHLSVAVNVSPLQLRRPDFISEVAYALRDSGLPGYALCLEITESTLLTDERAVGLRLGQLKKLGVSIALDDFGTGYSSLGRIHQLPVGTIKIDQVFVSDLLDRRSVAVIEAAVRLADRLGLKTIAEGVETEEQARKVGELGCRWAQGFLYSPPLAAVSVAPKLITLSRQLRAARQHERLPESMGYVGT